MEVGRWPPQEKDVQCRRKLPPLVLGFEHISSVSKTLKVEQQIKLTFRIILKDIQITIRIRYNNIKAPSIGQEICAYNLHIRSRFAEEDHLYGSSVYPVSQTLSLDQP
jgi:hypothetical protein